MAQAGQAGFFGYAEDSAERMDRDEGSALVGFGELPHPEDALPVPILYMTKRSR